MLGRMERIASGPSAAKIGDGGYRAAHRVGFVLDWGIDTGPLLDLELALHLALSRAVEAGVVDRPIDLFIREREGLPYNEFLPVLKEWQELQAEERCLLMVGPLGTDNALGVRPYAEQLGVPMLTTAGGIDVASTRRCFTLPCGTFIDNGALMAEWLVRRGASRVGVVRETNVFGEQYFEGFVVGSRRTGLEIVASHSVGYSHDIDSAAKTVQTFRSAGADAVAYMGWGTGVTPLMRVLAESDWDPLRILSDVYTCLSLPIGYGFEDVGPEITEGWAGIDFFAESNEIFVSMLDAFEQAHGRRPTHAYAALGWDLGSAIAEAFALAPRWDPEGIRQGLENVRMLPAALGLPGNVISFGPFDHRGYKGQYVVIRQICNGKDVLAT